ncbi:MAG: RNA polymerase sigma factor [Patescibacteria group bacterium]
MKRSDQELISTYLNGSEQSLEILIKRHLKSVYNFVFYKYANGNRQEAEDITQETFIKIWRNLKKFDLKKGNFKSWAFTIAKNTAIDHLKKKHAIPLSQLEKEKGENPLLENIATTTDDFANALDAKLTLAPFLCQLPQNYQQILTLHYQKGFSLQEIANLLHESVNTVKSRHRRALALLRKIIR